MLINIINKIISLKGHGVARGLALHCICVSSETCTYSFNWWLKRTITGGIFVHGKQGHRVQAIIKRHIPQEIGILYEDFDTEIFIFLKKKCTRYQFLCRGGL